MKNNLFTILLAGLLVANLVGCGPKEDPQSPTNPTGETQTGTISSLSVVLEETKQEYLIGEEFDATKIKVKALMSDSTSQVLTADAYNVDSSKFKKNEAGSYQITVSLKADSTKKTTFNAKVIYNYLGTYKELGDSSDEEYYFFIDETEISFIDINTNAYLVEPSPFVKTETREIYQLEIELTVESQTYTITAKINKENGTLKLVNGADPSDTLNFERISNEPTLSTLYYGMYRYDENLSTATGMLPNTIIWDGQNLTIGSEYEHSYNYTETFENVTFDTTKEKDQINVTYNHTQIPFELDTKNSTISMTQGDEVAVYKKIGTATKKLDIEGTYSLVEQAFHSELGDTIIFTSEKFNTTLDGAAKIQDVPYQLTIIEHRNARLTWQFGPGGSASCLFQL